MQCLQACLPRGHTQGRSVTIRRQPSAANMNSKDAAALAAATAEREKIREELEGKAIAAQSKIEVERANVEGEVARLKALAATRKLSSWEQSALDAAELKLAKLFADEMEAKATSAALRKQIAEDELRQYRKEAADRIRIYMDAKRARDAKRLELGDTKFEGQKHISIKAKL